MRAWRRWMLGLCTLCAVGGGACERNANVEVTQPAVEALRRGPPPAWRAVDRGIEGLAVSQLAVDAFWPQLAYAVTPQGVYRTGAGGSAWRHLDAIPSDKPVKVLTDPNRFGVAYAGSDHLYQTFDGGRSWSTNPGLDALPLEIGAARRVQPLAIAHGDSDVMFVSFAGARDIRLAKTSDGGKTWALAGLPSLRGACCLTLLAQGAENLWLSTLLDSPALYGSSDGGATWTRNQKLALSFIETLAVDPHDANVLYAAGLRTDDGSYLYVLRKSVDGGASWLAPTSQLDGQSVDRVAVSPVTGHVYAVVRDAGAQDGRVLVSTDGAASFVEATSGLEGQTITDLVPMPSLACGAYAATSTGVLRTYTAGGTCR